MARPDTKVRHSLKYFLQEVKTNDTIFNALVQQEYLHPDTSTALQAYLRPDQYNSQFGRSSKQHKTLTDLQMMLNFETDVLVYLHIQKVGGTVFNSHLINDLVLEFPCQCEQAEVLMNPCHCKTKSGNIWLFSWFTVGWPCGLHADWTMLHECVDEAMNKLEGKVRNRRYLYITLLRDPISRYVSEWKHQRSGEHWEDAKLRCDGKRVSLFEIRPCFRETWLGVSFSEFMDCRDNLATDRQTRMLADLTKSGCYKRGHVDLKERYMLRLKSAIENLGQMRFFGLTTYQKETQKLFERIFHVKFKADFDYLEDSVEDEKVSLDEFIEMFKYIELDVQLYLYAKDMFTQRTKLL